jgi:hypothetical protein
LRNVTEGGTSDEFVAAEIYADAAVVLDRALAGDRAAVTGAVDAVVHRGGVRGAYHLACALAATMVGDAPAAGFATLEFPEIEHAGYDARWVARFVTAFANADTPTGEALFSTAMADGHLSECLMTLAGTTVETLRRRAARG